MQRIFTLEDQLRFAEVSGDFNPIHVDPVAARRLLFGRPVVHGIHVLLWSLNCLFSKAVEQGNSRVKIESLRARWRAPVLVDQPVECEILSSEASGAKIRVSAGGAPLSMFEVRFVVDDRSSNGSTLPQANPLRPNCRDRSTAELKTATGVLGLQFDPALTSQLFPAVLTRLNSVQLAGLLASTRLVGMESPGLHSIYTALEVQRSDDASDCELKYQVDGYDDRFPMLLPMKVEFAGLRGKISSAIRPAPTQQAGINELRSLVRADEFSSTRALVIGGSRGLGELTVKLLAAGGADVRFTYHKGAADSEKIVQHILSSGGRAGSFQYDAGGNAANLESALCGFKPTMLCYFATPYIATATAGKFSQALFDDFCAIYVHGFSRAFDVLAPALKSVFYPSTVFIDELPPNMGEYAASKSAAENLCAFLRKVHPGIRIEAPRLPKVATDQTAGLAGAELADPKPILLDVLRKLARAS